MGLCEKTARSFFNNLEHHLIVVAQDLEGDGGNDEKEGSFTARTTQTSGLTAKT